VVGVQLFDELLSLRVTINANYIALHIQNQLIAYVLRVDLTQFVSLFAQL